MDVVTEIDHWAEAERLLARVANVEMPPVDDHLRALLSAQVHATLAPAPQGDPDVAATLRRVQDQLIELRQAVRVAMVNGGYRGGRPVTLSPRDAAVLWGKL